MESHIFEVDLKRKKKIRPTQRKRRRLRKYGINCSTVSCGPAQHSSMHRCNNPTPPPPPTTAASYPAAAVIAACSLISPASSISDDFERFDFLDHFTAAASSDDDGYDDSISFTAGVDCAAALFFPMLTGDMVALAQDTPPYTPPDADDNDSFSQDIRHANLIWSAHLCDNFRPIKRANANDKKVSFSSCLTTKVIFEETDEEADRKGCWEMYTRDAERFRRRIQSLSVCISPVLERSHRKSIFQSRFSEEH